MRFAASPWSSPRPTTRATCAASPTSGVPARQNVVFELGLLLAKLGRSRVDILLEHPDQMERPSDVQGLIYLPVTDSVDETKVLLAKEMDTAVVDRMTRSWTIVTVCWVSRYQPLRHRIRTCLLSNRSSTRVE